jgi:simple sugar transport system substrate-binding protein
MRKKILRKGLAPVLGAGLVLAGLAAGLTINVAGGSSGSIKYNYVGNKADGHASTLPGGLESAAQVNIIYVGCGSPTNPFWKVVYRGVKEAGENLGIHWKFLFPSTTTSTIAGLNQTTMSAIAAKPQGIALCGADPAGQASTVAEARAAGIQVVLTPPAGSDVIRTSKSPYIGQVGQDEPVGGQLAASQAVARWKAKSMVCTEDGTTATQSERCNALVSEAKKLGAKGAIQIVPSNTGQAESVMVTYLRAHPTVTTLASTNSTAALGMVLAKKSINKNSVHIIDFDLQTGVLTDIENGSITFAIDQQQYWRGYIPMLLLTQYLRYGLVMADNFLSGPSIVTKSNVKDVIKLVKQGIR